MLAARLDGALFVAAGLLSLWLAYLTLQEGIQPGWPALLVVVFWGLVAYLVLPRVHRILSRIYVPDYFIGRTRTADGLLGDPVNLAMLGQAEQLHAAMRAAGWNLADELTFGTGWRIVVSSLRRRTYATAPVSPLFLFQRRQDFAYQQEVAGNPSQRHHVRFWRCPDGWPLPGGVRVDWLAAGTYDRSVGLSLFTFQVTHKIDEDVDVERDHIVDGLQRVDPVVTLHVIEDFASGYHARNGGGDRISTDGNLPIVDLTGLPDAGAGAPAPPVPARPGPPLQVLFGAGVTAIRGLANLLFAGLAFAGRPEAIGSAVDPELTALLPAVGITLTCVALIDLGVTGFLLARRNWARMTLCCLSLVSAAVVFVTRMMANEHGRLGAELASLGLSVLVLLALSSEAARHYSIRYRETGEPGTAPAGGQETPPRQLGDGR